ncbi:MAG: hypothetical protein ACRD5D_10875, partial [Candidatus Polarisedimenticolia bacterium]
VGVARAVVAEPSLILADEPTGNLHSDQGREIMELFRSLNEHGTTIVQVTHSETNASFGRRIVRLRDGWIEGPGGGGTHRETMTRDQAPPGTAGREVAT